MHYGQDRPALLRHDPFKAILAPRPIGWIGTRSATGVDNLAPYSFFGAVSSRPNMVCFSADGEKHSYLNARDSGEFTVSFVSRDLFDGMNASSEELAAEFSEFDAAGLARGASVEVAAPFVADSPAAFECVTVTAEALRDRAGRLLDRYLVVGEIVATHIRDEFIRDGRFDTARAHPVVRAGYRDYADVSSLWEVARPDD